MTQSYCNIWWRVLQGCCVRRVVIALLMILTATTLLMMQSTLRVLSLQDRLLWWPSQANPQSSSKLIVDTPSCQILDIHAYNPGISQSLLYPKSHFVVCTRSKPITFTDRQYIRLNTTLAKSLSITHCLHQQVS